MNHNMKKRGLALLLACCCVFTAAPVAVKADNVSISTNQTPTGTYSSYTKAEVLKSDTVVYDTLSTSNNVHFYKYTAEKAGYFTVNLAQTSGKGKWNFSVYDADNGNQELETKPLASNYTSRIYNLRPGKSVYIKVERVKSTDITILDYQLTQDYQYSLQVKTTESGNRKTTIHRRQRQVCRTAHGSMEVPTKLRMWTGMSIPFRKMDISHMIFRGRDLPHSGICICMMKI